MPPHLTSDFYSTRAESSRPRLASVSEGEKQEPDHRFLLGRRAIWKSFSTLCKISVWGWISHPAPSVHLAENACNCDGHPGGRPPPYFQELTSKSRFFSSGFTLSIVCCGLQRQPYVQTTHPLSRPDFPARCHPFLFGMSMKKSTHEKRIGPEALTPSRTAAELIPPHATLEQLKTAARKCKACDLWKLGTQTVFGEGLPEARVMLVGEQPGDQEDRAGHPFVGPAGRLLNLALARAGIDRSQVYVTNVVKHFKWSQAERGTRRIHKKPRYSEIQACRPWLDAELEIVKPEVLVCLGASSAQSLLGRDFRVSQERGKLVESALAPYVLATVHPSSILRAQDEDSRHLQLEAFINDLKKVAQLLRAPAKKNRAA